MISTTSPVSSETQPSAGSPQGHGYVVTMLELVTSAHTLDGTLMDAKELLKLMDICTCAAAEKHTKVQCVTVSMGDVVFEYFPTRGDLLELTARPVYTGTTSLDVALTVVAEFRSTRTTVCEACFTYVTTRGQKGEKRLCPPLACLPQHHVGGEQFEWDLKMARYRKALVKVERTSFCVRDEDIQGFDLEMTEVVLPAHQNHMGHTFGGVVMAWMAKAAMTAAMRLSKRSCSHLLIRSIVRIDFQCGSDVSDHLILRPRVNAVFDEGRSAEVEVRVYKTSIATGEETRMNVGYFFISGSLVGTGTDLPFGANSDFFVSDQSSHLLSTSEDRIRQGAAWRRRLLLARSQLLSGLGDVVEWHPSLHQEAPMLTVESVLRLVHHNDSSVEWLQVAIPAQADREHVSVEWIPGETWGRKDTFVLRAKGVLKGARLLENVLDTLKSYRSSWDKFCHSVEVLESSESSDNSSTPLQWDVVRHGALTPRVAIEAREKALGEEAVDAVVPLCLLRTWQLDPAGNTAILASQSVTHPKAMQVVAQVRPSGWFLRKDHPEQDYVNVTYIVEHDLTGLRKVCPGMSDATIVQMFALIAIGWMDRLGGLLDC